MCSRTQRYLIGSLEPRPDESDCGRTSPPAIPLWKRDPAVTSEILFESVLHEFGEADTPAGCLDLLPDVRACAFTVLGTVRIRLGE